MTALKTNWNHSNTEQKGLEFYKFTSEIASKFYNAHCEIMCQILALSEVKSDILK